MSPMRPRLHAPGSLRSTAGCVESHARGGIDVTGGGRHHLRRLNPNKAPSGWIFPRTAQAMISAPSAEKVMPLPP